MITEADTCRKYVLPKLIQAGWDDDPHSFTEQKTFTDGRIVLAGNKTRRRPQKRADQLRKDKKDFFTKFGSKARAILNELLDKYAEHGTAKFVIPDVLKVPPISEHSNVIEIAAYIGGPEKLREVVNDLQEHLYAV